MPVKPELTTSIYFAVALDRSGFKVGVSANPLKRAFQLGEEIDLEHSVQFVCSRAEAFQIEKTLHFLFKKHRLHKEPDDGYTEWFVFSAFDEILNFVFDNQDKLRWIACEPLLKPPTAVEDRSEPDYVKIYLDGLEITNDLTGGQSNILFLLAAQAAYDGVVSLTKPRKQRIADMLEGSCRSIDNAITEFVKREILLRVGRAEYELNPHLFAKGSWKEIRERRLQFTTRITYSAERGRTIETTIDSADSKKGEAH